MVARLRLGATLVQNVIVFRPAARMRDARQL